MNVVSYLTNRVLPPKFEEKGSGSEKIGLNSAGRTAKPESVDLDVPIAQNQDTEKSRSDSDHVEKSISRSRKVGRMAWAILIFMPNLLLVKPVLFFWFVVTFPLSFVERSGKEKNKSEFPQDTNAVPTANTTGYSPAASNFNTIAEEEDDMGGEEMILQPDTVKGSLAAKRPTPDPNLSPSQQQQQEHLLSPPAPQAKSAKSAAKATSVRSGASSNAGVMLGSRRMGRFLFPKKLIPQSMLNRQKRRTLVLDLDETLIHSMSRGTSSSNSSQGHMVEVKFAVSGISTLYYVHKRPYCDFFLTKVWDWYDLVIFTASMREYADPVIDWLEGSFPGRFSRRLYRQDCTLRDGIGYIKDLSLLAPTHAPLSDVFIIDNSPVSYAMHVDNAIQVEGWISDPTDTDLLNLLPFLEALRFTTDVRNVLALKNGECAFAM
ncbi:LAME_0G15390g1_1 [Lachancea meyersii CBS 8951]|uniref:LAME_0G15390g1_1 n=1 Tax=Lachancea meyersii CBS 8951 TaxID=1266667 RepID=A0A1G4KAQ5_9SACH|nr:LAME_0G15390g1_1 [Lachancea meyersii CBS 8951]